MLKSSAPVAVLFFSWIWGVADPSVGKLVNIVVIVLGVALASAGEIEFSWLGFGFQVGGIVFEAMRLVMIQVMLSGEGLNMDPLVSLYYYAPVCAVMNALVSLTGEWQRFHWEDLVSTGWLVLLANALVAFLLNVASVSLVCVPGFLGPSQAWTSYKLTVTDWQNIGPRDDTDRHTEEYYSRHCLRHHLED